jgi:hypothetical protein
MGNFSPDEAFFESEVGAATLVSSPKPDNGGKMP